MQYIDWPSVALLAICFAAACGGIAIDYYGRKAEHEKCERREYKLAVFGLTKTGQLS